MNPMLAVQVDPMTIAGAVVMVLGGIGAMIVQVINAWHAAKDRQAAQFSRAQLLDKANVAAGAAQAAAKETGAAHVKLDSIKVTTEKAAENVNGNLSAVRGELNKAMELNKNLLDTIQSLMETVKSQRAQSRATDHQPVVKVDVVGLPPEIVAEAKKP